MKRTLLFVLAMGVIPVAVDAQSTSAASCADLSGASPFEDWRTCAEQGDALAQYNLGVMYGNGYGVPEDDAEAVRWYRLAAEQGYAEAQYNLGLMYANGEGVPENRVPENHVLAYMWFNLAAAQGNEVARGNKGTVEGRMTREQIAEAQRMSTEWIEAHPPGGN